MHYVYTCKVRIIADHSSFLTAVYSELYKANEFETMSLDTDENEHSIEMHLPYVAKVMERCVIAICTWNIQQPKNYYLLRAVVIEYVWCLLTVGAMISQ